MKHLAILSAALVLVVGAAADDKKAALDPAKLPGDYTYVSGSRAGNKVEKEKLGGKVTITKETITLAGDDGSKFVLAYKVDAKKSPATIDLEIKEGPMGQGSKAEGIVSLEGDELKLCYVPMIGGDGKRPTKFESTADNKAHYYVLKRAKK